MVTRHGADRHSLRRRGTKRSEPKIDGGPRRGFADADGAGADAEFAGALGSTLGARSAKCGAGASAAATARFDDTPLVSAIAVGSDLKWDQVSTAASGASAPPPITATGSSTVCCRGEPRAPPGLTQPLNRSGFTPPRRPFAGEHLC